jgi:hypothetical protein
LDIDGSNDKRPGTKKEKRIGIHETLNIAAWCVRSIGIKESELVEEIKTKGINVAVIFETRKKLKGTKIIGNYLMLDSGVSQEILICQRSHNNRSPQNQQRAHNYNRSLCSGRRQGGRNETFLQTTTKRS